MDRPQWAPLDIDLSRPSAARIYDYYLGGSHNFEIDRVIARQAIQVWPELPALMQGNRAFLRRAVQFMISQGITQFIDIGSGIPTAGNVHEVAQSVNPAARVAYVDHDPIAVLHSRAMLVGDDQTVVVEADLREPATIVEAPAVASLIDMAKPVGVLMIAVLHFVPDADDPAAVIARLAQHLAPGSHLALSHATSEFDPIRASQLEQLYAQTPTPMRMRTAAEVAALFGPFKLVDPGVVEMSRWRPRPGQAVASDEPAHVGVGRLTLIPT